MLVAPACGKKKLDKHVDALIEALQKDDYDRFVEISHSGLQDNFPKRKFSNLAKAINQLGKFEERTMQGIHVKSGGFKEGRYKLDFSAGTIKLVIKLRNSKLVSFKFSGDPIEKAMKKVRNASYKKFKVLGFQFLDDAGKKKNNIYQVGQKIPFKVGVQGLKAKDGKFHLRADLQLTTSNGKVLMRKAGFIDSTIDIKPDGPPVATVSGKLSVPKKGTYKIQLRIIDKVAGKKLAHQQMVSVE
jgi:hypothetical protein